MQIFWDMYIMKLNFFLFGGFWWKVWFLVSRILEDIILSAMFQHRTTQSSNKYRTGFYPGSIDILCHNLLSYFVEFPNYVPTLRLGSFYGSWKDFIILSYDKKVLSMTWLHVKQLSAKACPAQAFFREEGSGQNYGFNVTRYARAVRIT